MLILNKYIKDQSFLDLIRKYLNVGYAESNKKSPFPFVGYGTRERRKDTRTEVAQGGRLSSILSNIYLNELDEYMEKIKNIYETPQNEKRNRKSPAFYLPTPHIPPLSVDGVGRKLGDGTEGAERKTGIRIYYIRYANEFLIGMRSNKELTEKIKNKISEFLKEKLKIELKMEKTLIINIKKNTVKFLEFKIKSTGCKYLMETPRYLPHPSHHTPFSKQPGLTGYSPPLIWGGGMP